MTYSIVARDPATGELGVAVQSHFFAVGSSVAWAEPGVGAVATQAFVRPDYGPRGLALMRDGASPRDALDELLAADPGRDVRQVAMVGAAGAIAVHTGRSCVQACGDATGDDASAQGNMLVPGGVWTAMLEAFEAEPGDLAARLLAALGAGEAAGGDARGRQAAAILVVGIGGDGDDRIDCRVDDHPDPLGELRRLVSLSRLYGRMRGLMGVPGLMTGDPVASPKQVEEALAVLEEGERLLGENQEATMWRGIVLARFGREDEARAAFADAIARRPQLAEYLRGFPLLPEDVRARLLR